MKECVICGEQVADSDQFEKISRYVLQHNIVLQPIALERARSGRFCVLESVPAPKAYSAGDDR